MHADSAKGLESLQIWQLSMDFAERVCKRILPCMPKEEKWSLVEQLRRSTQSIPANIAEGCGRNGDAEFARFLQIAMGSASELEYHLLLAHDLKFLSHYEHEKLANEVIDVKRMLTSFIQKLRADG